MKIEEIIPEIRKGRRFRFLNGQWMNYGNGENPVWPYLSVEQMMRDDWELEPERIELSGGVYATPAEDGYYIRDAGGLVGSHLAHSEIDILHGASLKARGLDKPQREPDAIAPGRNINGLTEDQIGVRDGWRLITEGEAKLPPDTQYWGPVRELWYSRATAPHAALDNVDYRTKAPLPKSVCPECNGTGTVMTQAGAGMYEFDCKKCAEKLSGVDPEYWSMTPEEAWDKFKLDNDVHSNFNSVLFKKAYALGQRSVWDAHEAAMKGEK